ncbi:MAG: hypothetical protein ACTS2F_22255 [Thainema sp.]
MLTFSCFAWKTLCLVGILSLFIPSVAQANETQTGNQVDVPIRLVSVSKNGTQLQLWIEGSRIDGCDLPLELIEQPPTSEENLSAENLAENVTEIRIRVFHTLPAHSDCVGEYQPFTVPFMVQQPIETGQVYQIWVNDYYFTLEDQTSDEIEQPTDSFKFDLQDLQSL